MACSVGSIIAPVLGGELTDALNYRSTCDIVAGIAFVVSILNFLVVFLPGILQKRAAEKKKENFLIIENL